MALFWCQPHLNEERVPQILRILPLCQQKLWAFFPLGDCELSILALSDNIKRGEIVRAADSMEHCKAPYRHSTARHIRAVRYNTASQRGNLRR